MRKSDEQKYPYHDIPIVHMAHRMSNKGDVKALCFKRNQAINLGIASWTITPKWVTCKKCKKLMEKAN